MFGGLLANLFLYGLIAFVVVFFAYNIWSGLRESNEDEQFVFEKLSKLFETRPESYVVRSLTAPNSSKVGSIRLGDFSAIGSVYSGPHEIFIGNHKLENFFSIPWERVNSIKQSSNKRVTLLVNSPPEKPTEIEIPWSDNMTLEGWERYKDLNE